MGSPFQKRPCWISWQTGQRCCLGLISWQCYCNICVLRDFWDQNFLTSRGHGMGKSKRFDCWMSMANVWLVVLKGYVLWACPPYLQKKIFIIPLDAKVHTLTTKTEKRNLNRNLSCKKKSAKWRNKHHLQIYNK